MKSTYKRITSVILLIALLLTFNAVVINNEKNTVYASDFTAFENEFDYEFKDLDDFSSSGSSNQYVSMEDLYDVVSAVSINSRYFGFIDEPALSLTPTDIEEHIEYYYPNVILQAGDWVTAKQGSVEYKGEYNGTTWINAGIFDLDNQIKNNILSLVGSKKVTIKDADDLFKLGNMASINFDRQARTNSYIFSEIIQTVLSLHYVLLDDIDYSSKKAQRFVPLGTNIDIDMDGQDIIYDFPFTGTFDGQGFTIKGLFFADYNYISTVFQDDDASTAITAALFQHYSMFASIGTTGVVKNFMLVDPNFDLIIGDELVGLYKTSILAGINRGTIYNVGVIDKKRNQLGQENAGISFRIPLASIDTYTASGFVYDNEGAIYNSFLSTNRILNSASTVARFTKVEAFVANNTGTLTGVSYANTIIDLKNSVNDNIVPKYSEANYYNGVGINLNDWNGYDPSERLPLWYFYPEDGYPSLFGLTYNDTNSSDKFYEINDDYEFMIFARLIALNSNVNGKPYRNHTFKLMNDINMEQINSFKAIKSDFNGTLTSYGSIKYIYNLHISTPLIDGSNYYLGIFSNLKGTFKNINILNSSLTATQTELHYGKTFYVGMVSGRLNGGTIEDVYINSEIDLGASALGTTYVGTFAGLANGSLLNVGSVKTNNGFGKIEGGTHNFNDYSIIPKFYVGGLVGTNDNKLKILNSFNEINVSGISSNNANYNATQSVETFTGGIIGEVNNINNDTVSIVYVTNYGNITAGQIYGKSSSKSSAFTGGVFGSTKGYGYKANTGNDLYNGRLENKGNIVAKFIDINTVVYGAGIGVMNTNETLASVSYVINRGGFTYTNYNYQTSNKELYYAATVIDNSNTGITLSRAYNATNFALFNTFFSNVSGASAPTEVEVALFFNSTKNSPSKLHYVENMGKLDIGSNNGSNVYINRKLKISNITQASRIDYLNVINSGNINVLRVENNSSANTNTAANSIYVAGITWILPYDNRAYLMTNVLNEGNITTAGITSNTTFNGTVEGPAFSDTQFDGNLHVKNLYVAGLVNINVGEITNSFNMGDLRSTYTNELKDITGTANTFVGGINTFNYNLIKDSANSGLIEYINSNNSAFANFAANFELGTAISGTNRSTFGGISISYNGGIVVAGISAAFGHYSGTELNGHKDGYSGNSQVIDTINNGDVFGKSKYYVRSAGIVAIALAVELSSGTFRNTSKTNQITAGPFNTAVIGNGDPMLNALLSNGLNFGNIYAVTQIVGNYGTSFGTGTGDTAANAVRPGINSAAGGVIAYGLTTMVRMINHGLIAATDVAGGVVGATYVLGDATTPVNINTAVHYGRVKAIKIGEYNSDRHFVPNVRTYNNFNYISGETASSSRFYQSHEYDDYIYYYGNASSGAQRNPDIYQQARRGFGGIFGRLQRGNRGAMNSSEFMNIMNMDDEIDFVGRVDSNTHLSLVFYRLYDHSKGETYFTAKENDMSYASFTGWNRTVATTMNFNNATVEFTVRRSASTYYIRNINVIDGDVTLTRTQTKMVKNVNDTSTSSANSRTLTAWSIEDFRGYALTDNTTQTGTNFIVANFGLTSSDYGSISSGQERTFTVTGYSRNNVSFSYTGGSTSAPDTTNVNMRYPIKKISDSADGRGIDIFKSDFTLMNPANSEFIYAVEVDALASRFQSGGTNAKTHGMYVLASSTGSLDGATLPTNIKVNNLFRINEDEKNGHYLDLNNIIISDQVIPDELEVGSLTNRYFDMYQVAYNDKAEVLGEDENANPIIAELTLYDPSGNSPLLSGGVIDRATNTITYTVSTTAFSSNNVNYEILSNELSKGAIAAKRGTNSNNDYKLTSNEYDTLKDDYGNAVDFVLPSDSSVKWTASGSVTSGNSIDFTMRIYSEMFIHDQNIYNANKYYQDYTIVLVRSSTEITFNGALSVDGGTSQSFNNANINSGITASNNMNPDGNLEALFVGDNTNSNNLIPNYHELDFMGLFHNDVLIDPSFYTYESIAKGILSNANEFGFKITLSDQLEQGSYQVRYRIYTTMPQRTITFTKNGSTNYDISNLEHDYFSQDNSGNNLVFNPTNSNFTTYTKFGYPLYETINRNQAYSLVISAIEKANKNEFTYDNDIIGYELILNGNTIIDNFEISPFASLLSATIKYNYLPSGLIEYEITYTIKPESGVNQTIVHKIIERAVTNIESFVDNNLQTSNSFTITREAILSKIDVDFDFINNDLYDLVTMKVDNVDHVDNDEIMLIENYDRFSFGITYLQEPENFEYNFIITREGSYSYDLGTIDITKNKGKSAYLIDVKYEGLDGGAIFKYPTISPSNNAGVEISGYDTRFYPGGIDYLDLEGSIYNFRINSEVADIDLEHYVPGFILPYGASIQRFDKATNSWTTPTTDVNDDSLKTDYIGFDDDIEVIHYRVIPEENASNDFETNSVSYFLSAVDIEYNLTIRFNVYYNHPTHGIIHASDSRSPIDQSIVVISLKQYKLDDVYPIVGDANLVANFPSLNKTNFEGLNAQSTLFYFVNQDQNINFRFGRNRTGAYNFTINAPKYSGPDTNDLSNNERYKYSMFVVPRDSTITQWNQSIYELPAMDTVYDGNKGLFYFVYSPTTNPITRELAIVINPETVDKKWGIYDDYGSFD